MPITRPFGLQRPQRLDAPRLKAIPGAAVPLVGSSLFLDSHIYWPKGVIASTCVAIGVAATSYVSAVGSSAIEDSTRT